MIQRKRIYEPSAPSDGQRLLVDRLWPRGVSKLNARLDDWLKVIAPSTALRQAYHQGSLTFAELTERYEAELLGQPEAVACLTDLAARSATQALTFIYAARDTEQNHVCILMGLLQRQFGALCSGEALA
ncbi:MAG: DUF488 family protein [Neisseriaceae bacterium]|nr:DUF488 family protein [Neisseriaceae bacterium]MBP6862001.1 DUF488 family protein [Neisseriaceae bacterium]